MQGLLLNLMQCGNKCILCSVLIAYYPFSALTLLVGWQERYPACKKLEWWGAGPFDLPECQWLGYFFIGYML